MQVSVFTLISPFHTLKIRVQAVHQASAQKSEKPGDFFRRMVGLFVGHPVYLTLGSLYDWSLFIRGEAKVGGECGLPGVLCQHCRIGTYIRCRRMSLHGGGGVGMSPPLWVEKFASDKILSSGFSTSISLAPWASSQTSPPQFTEFHLTLLSGLSLRFLSYETLFLCFSILSPVAIREKLSFRNCLYPGCVSGVGVGACGHLIFLY